MTKRRVAKFLMILAVLPALAWSAAPKPKAKPKAAKPAAEATPAPKPVPIAVSELEIREGVAKGKADLLTDILRTELLATERFEVMNREDMDSILKELKFQQSGACDSTSCLVEMGQALGVQKMVSGSIGKLGEKYAITCKLVDLRSSRNELQFTEYYEGAEEDLDQVMRYMAGKLAGKNPGPLQVRRTARLAKGAEASVQGPKRSAILASALSLAVPGLGQLYNGQNKLKAFGFLALGGTGQVYWFLGASEAGKAREEYQAFAADPELGLVKVEGNLTGFEYWSEEHKKARTRLMVGFAVRATFSALSALDAYIFAKKHRRGLARVEGGPALGLDLGPDEVRVSLNWSLAGGRKL